jgi:hypothetical protein
MKGFTAKQLADAKLPGMPTTKRGVLDRATAEAWKSDGTEPRRTVPRVSFVESLGGTANRAAAIPRIRKVAGRSGDEAGDAGGPPASGATAAKAVCPVVETAAGTSDLAKPKKLKKLSAVTWPRQRRIKTLRGATLAASK